LESVTAFIYVFVWTRDEHVAYRNLLTVVSATEIIHCAYRMVVLAAFEIHFSRVVKNILVAYSVIRLWPT